MDRGHGEMGHNWSDYCPECRKEREGDRGVFGMPTLGTTSAGFDVTHEPLPGMPQPKVRVLSTAEAQIIVEQLIPEFIDLFLEKNRKYAKVQTMCDLGVKGIVPDVNRKLGIIIDRIWDGNPTVGEGTREVIMDAIGHLFLMLTKDLPS